MVLRVSVTKRYRGTSTSRNSHGSSYMHYTCKHDNNTMNTVTLFDRMDSHILHCYIMHTAALMHANLRSSQFNVAAVILYNSTGSD